jgi:hypothetical protein
MATTDNIYKVKLVNANAGSERVTFDVSPDFTENRAVNYTPLETVQAPGQIFIYKNTSSRTFDLGDVKLISRSQVEASKNMRNLQWIRSWTLPWFGGGTSSSSLGTTSNSAQSIAGVEVNQESLEANEKRMQETTANMKSDNIVEYAHENENLVNVTSTGEKQAAMLREQTRELFEDPSKLISKGAALGTGGSGGSGSGSGSGGEELGAPPAILYFSAYSSGNDGNLTNLNKIPVVIQNLSISYPSDVDFIPTMSLEPMPTIMSISISLVETHAPIEYNNFSLMQYKEGILPRF